MTVWRSSSYRPTCVSGLSSSLAKPLRCCIAQSTRCFSFFSAHLRNFLSFESGISHPPSTERPLIDGSPHSIHHITPTLDSFFSFPAFVEVPPWQFGKPPPIPDPPRSTTFFRLTRLEQNDPQPLSLSLLMSSPRLVVSVPGGNPRPLTAANSPFSILHKYPVAFCLWQTSTSVVIEPFHRPVLPSGRSAKILRPSLRTILPAFPEPPNPVPPFPFRWQAVACRGE